MDDTQNYPICRLKGFLGYSVFFTMVLLTIALNEMGFSKTYRLKIISWYNMIWSTQSFKSANHRTCLWICTSIIYSPMPLSPSLEIINVINFKLNCYCLTGTFWSLSIWHKIKVTYLQRLILPNLMCCVKSHNLYIPRKAGKDQPNKKLYLSYMKFSFSVHLFQLS